jgi:hypothetical protein
MNPQTLHDVPHFAVHDVVAHGHHRAQLLLTRTARLLFVALMCAGLPALWAPTVQAQDLALTTLMQPASGCALTSSEDVTIRMFNHGSSLTAGATIQVLYGFVGGSAFNDLITLGSDFPSKTSLDFTFATPADLSAPGDYHLMVALNLAGDINPGNNTLHDTLVRNTAPSVAGTINVPASGGSGTLSLSGHTGAVAQWEESPDAQRWFKLASDSTTQNFSGLTEATHFRVRVVNAPCPAAVSNAVTVVP